MRIAVGVILVAVAIRQRWRMRRPKKTKKAPKWQEHVDSMSSWFAVGLAPVVQPWALIAAGAATVTAARLSSPESYLVLALFCILASAPYLGIEGYASFRPGTSHAFLAKFRTWIETHTDQLIIWGGLILGFWLIGKSIYLIAAETALRRKLGLATRRVCSRVVVRRARTARPMAQFVNHCQPRARCGPSTVLAGSRRSKASRSPTASGAVSAACRLRAPRIGPD